MISRQNVARTIYSFLQSNKFFYISLGLFILGVTWIAIASIYPMAFDEEFHYGLIKIYATSWLPYGIEHTADMAQYGSATADASYLFHYLMSFPYRLLDFLGLPNDVIIVLLRLINIGLIASAIVIFRRTLLENSIGKATSNLAITFFMFIPALSMLTAQINYDSLLLLIVALSILLTLRVTRSVLAKKGFPTTGLLIVIILQLYGMSTKYAYLPIAAAIALWLVLLVAIGKQKLQLSLTKQVKNLCTGVKKITLRTKLFIAIFGVLGIFFVAHYGVNYVTYGAAIPPCEKVFDTQACKAYGPWNRNQEYVATKNPNFIPKPLPVYIVEDWLPGMSRRLSFSLAGKTNGFLTKPPLPVLHFGFIALTVLGVACLLYRLVFDRKNVPPIMWLTLLVTLLYCGALLKQLYGDYVITSVPVAINGRYLLLILPLVAGVLMHSIAHVASKKIPRPALSIGATLTVVLFLVSGAGSNSYIIRSDPHWLWPGFGQSSQKVLQPIVNIFTVTQKN